MSDEEKLKLRRKNFIRGTLFAKLWKMNDLQNLVKNSNITKIHSTVFVFKQSHLARSCGYPNILKVKTPTPFDWNPRTSVAGDNQLMCDNQHKFHPDIHNWNFKYALTSRIDHWVCGRCHCSGRIHMSLD